MWIMNAHLPVADWLSSLQTLFAMLPVWIKPLWIVAVGVVAAVVGLWVGLALLGRLAPRVAAILRTTSKEATSQPLFYILLSLGIVMLLLSPILPYNTFGEDIKLLKAEGLTFIKLLAIVMAVWTASVSIAEEIEGRTALTVLSKPVARWKMLVGKFLGVMLPVTVMFIVLGALFLCAVSYKVKYDAREVARPEPTVEECRGEILQSVPGLALAYLEALVMASVAAAISTRFPLLPNLLVCASIYALGHLLPTVVIETADRLEFVAFAAKLLAVVLPGLEYFSMETAIATGRLVSWDYLALAGLYSLVYMGLTMVLGLLLFEDRDLA
jgi:ABC-type transport system involved in multi-copper enzyme maturation permease subunit